MDETSVEVPGLGFIAVRSYAVGGIVQRWQRPVAAGRAIGAEHGESSSAGGPSSVLLVLGSRLGARPQGHAPCDSYQQRVAGAFASTGLDRRRMPPSRNVWTRFRERWNVSIARSSMMFSAQDRASGSPVDRRRDLRASQEPDGGPGDSTARRGRARTEGGSRRSSDSKIRCNARS